MSQGNGTPPQATLDLITEALKGIGKIERRKFQLWEVEDLEEALPGQPILDQFYGDAPLTTKFLRGLLWLRLRRDHPQLVFDDFRTLDMGTFEDAIFSHADEEPDPTSGASAPSSSGRKQKPSRASATSGG